MIESELVFVPLSTSKRFIDLTGHAYHSLTVLGLVENTNKRKFWACRCVCSNITIIRQTDLRSGRQKSCGCHRREIGRTNGIKSAQHGKSDTPEYACWLSMLYRCNVVQSKSYKNYGGRGIKVCDRWKDSFENFLTDMGPRPSDRHSIERKDVNGNYEPDNCEWADIIKQANNKQTSKFIEVHGVRKTVAQWCRLYGLDPATYRHRVQWRLEHGRPLDDLYA